jgi:hypothetical protein
MLIVSSDKLKTLETLPLAKWFTKTKISLNHEDKTLKKRAFQLPKACKIRKRRSTDDM